MKAPRLRIGIAGVGRMGGYHLQKLTVADGVEIAGIFEPKAERAAEILARHPVRVFDKLSDLLFESDALVVSSPTAFHYSIARAALEAGVHVLIEKPISETFVEAMDLVRIAEERQLVLQVGFVERFRLRALAEGIISGPVQFIEAHRLSPTRPREATIDVVSDLMIHDLDLALSLVGEQPTSVSAIGMAVLTPHFDVANVRLEFPSGAVANLSASRISARPMRKFRYFAGDGYASMDFIGNTVEYHRRGESAIEQQVVARPDFDGLREQCDSFLHCVRTGDKPLVSGLDGANSLRCAELVRERIAERTGRLARHLIEGRDGAPESPPSADPGDGGPWL